MQAIEISTRIGKNGHIELPAEYREAFGKTVRLLVLLPEHDQPPKKRRQPGSAKGILKVRAEDDEHLEAFRDYMP